MYPMAVEEGVQVTQEMGPWWTLSLILEYDRTAEVTGHFKDTCAVVTHKESFEESGTILQTAKHLKKKLELTSSEKPVKLLYHETRIGEYLRAT